MAHKKRKKAKKIILKRKMLELASASLRFEKKSMHFFIKKSLDSFSKTEAGSRSATLAWFP
jgi:hypothetical protein